MKKWYKKSYFDKEAWILENFDKLSLSSDEVLLLLIINHSINNSIKLSYEYLSKKMNKTSKQLDKIISNLVARHYLNITTNNRGIVFDIDGVFEFDVDKFDVLENNDVFNTLEIVFGRPLNPNELQKSSDLIDKYGQNNFIDACRIAEAKRNVKMPYIEGILKNNEKK